MAIIKVERTVPDDAGDRMTAEEISQGEQRICPVCRDHVVPTDKSYLYPHDPDVFISGWCECPGCRHQGDYVEFGPAYAQ